MFHSFIYPKFVSLHDQNHYRMTRNRNVHKFALFALLSLLAICASCDNVRKQRLQREIAKINMDLPVTQEGIGRMDSLSLDDEGHIVTYHYVVFSDNQLFNADLVSDNIDLVKRKLVNTLLAGGKKALDIFIQNKVGLRYSFNEEETGKNVVITIPLDELEKAVKRPISSSEAADLALKDDLVISRLSLPLPIDQGLKIVDYLLDDDNLYYVIDVDERLYPLGGDFNIEEAKKGIREELDENNTGLMTTISHLKKTNRGLVYRYVGNNSKKQIDVGFSAYELKTIFPHI